MSNRAKHRSASLAERIREETAKERLPVVRTHFKDWPQNIPAKESEIN